MPEEIISIEEVYGLLKKIEIFSDKNLVEILDHQLMRLADIGYFELAGFYEILVRVEDLYPKLDKLVFQDGNFPFVVVVSKKLVPIRDQFSSLKFNDLAGHTELKTEEIHDRETIEIPGGIYLIADVEIGDRNQGKSPADCLKDLEAEERSVLTAEEGIALVHQCPELLHERFLNLAGSYYREPEIIPEISVDIETGRPRLDETRLVYGIPQWMTPSCKKRIF